MSEERLQMHKALQAGVTPFAVTTYRNRERVFGIKVDDRRRHVYVIGKTGMGKTTLIENMVYSDIVAGHGVCYVDPHGDTAEKMLGWIPSNRINDVIYFNPSDINFPISFNVLEKVSPEYRHLISSGLIGVFKKQWADSWGPRLEYILRNAILALLEYPDSTLLGINRILVDKVYRKKVVDRVQDPVVRSFWIDEFTKWNDRVLQEVISPIQNKVGQFLSTSLIRNIVGQVKSTIDLRKVMDEGKILILNLSKGRIGEDASALLGAMMVTKIQLAAMSRVDIQEEVRNDFYLYVDEFQNFATDSFANILSEARKYRLNLIIAHQYIEQLGEVVKPAVFGNVGTLICFRVGAEDAEFLENEFAPNILPEDLVNLPKYHFYTKLMIDGVTSEPFSAKGLPPVWGETLGNEEKAIRASRERYTKPRDVVEDKIMRWSSGNKDALKLTSKDREAGVTVDVFAKRQEGRREEQGSRSEFRREEGQGARPMERGQTRPQTATQQIYQANCYNCGNEVEVPFKPDNIRPVYCKDCLKKARRGEIRMKQPAAKQDVVEEKKVQPPVSFAEIKKQTVDFKAKPMKETPSFVSAAATSYAKATEVMKATEAVEKKIQAEAPIKAVPVKETVKEPSFAKATDGRQKGEEANGKEAWKKEIVRPWEIKAAPMEKPIKPEIKKEETKIERLKVKAEPKPLEKPKEIKPSFAKATADRTEGMEKKSTLEIKAEKPKEVVKKPEIKVVKPEPVKEFKKPETVIEKPKEEKKVEPPKPKMASVNLLAEDDSKTINEGDVVEF